MPTSSSVQTLSKKEKSSTSERIRNNSNSFKSSPRASYSFSSTNNNNNNNNLKQKNQLDLASISQKLEYDYLLTPIESTPSRVNKISKEREMNLISMQNMYHNSDLLTFSYIKKVNRLNIFS